MSAQPAAGVLSHIEVTYRRGDRQLAIDLFEALGCKTYDTETKSLTGATYISAHPDPNDRSLDNVLYVSEMTDQQCALEKVLREKVEADPDLREACEAYRGLAGEKPFGLCHIAIRYPDFETLERVLAEVEQRLTPELRARSSIKVFRQGDCEEIGWNSVQAFVYTDIATSGISAFGQIYELSAYGDWS